MINCKRALRDRLKSLLILPPLLLWAATVQAAPLDFTVNMSEAVDVDTTGGTPRIAVNVGGVTRYASYSGGTGTSALTFTYTPQAGDLDLDGVAVSSPVDLNSGTIKDLSGNDVSTLTFVPPNTASVRVDYPSLSLDFINSDYVLSGTHYASLPAFLTAAGGTYTRASAATYFDVTGIMQTAGSNTPRFDYDPVTHAAKGLLLEEARTNLLQRSAAFDNAAWLTNGRATITANAALAPDGTLSAELLTEDSTATQTHGIYTNVGSGITAGQNYTYSVYAKNASGSRQLNLQIVNTGGAWAASPGAFFNISTGTVGNVTAGSSSSITHVGNGWYRCVLTSPAATATVASVGAKQIYLASGNTQVFSGDGASGLYIWGAQLEVGSFPTSYIATAGATVTRPRDSLTIPTGAWHNANQGTIYGDFIWESAAGTAYPMLMRFDDGTSTNRWNFFFNQNVSRIGFDGYTGGVGQGSQSVGGVATSGAIELAAAQATNNTNVSYSGILGTLDTTWNPPTTVNTLTFVSSVPLSKWLKSFKYYPTRVIDAQLQLLTQ